MMYLLLTLSAIYLTGLITSATILNVIRLKIRMGDDIAVIIAILWPISLVVGTAGGLGYVIGPLAWRPVKWLTGGGRGRDKDKRVTMPLLWMHGLLHS